jgi:hypothetical protein
MTLIKIRILSLWPQAHFATCFNGFTMRPSLEWKALNLVQRNGSRFHDVVSEVTFLKVPSCEGWAYSELMDLFIPWAHDVMTLWIMQPIFSEIYSVVIYNVSEFWGFLGSDVSSRNLLGCDAVQGCGRRPTLVFVFKMKSWIKRETCLNSVDCVSTCHPQESIRTVNLMWGRARFYRWYATDMIFCSKFYVSVFLFSI